MEDKMERELPKYYVGNSWFTVDVMKDELREVNRSDNVISFKDMAYEGKWYEFWYDAQARNIARHFPDIDDSFHRIRLPPLSVLDPEGLAQMAGVKLNELKGKTDTELLTDPLALERRRNGELPVVGLAGHDFEVDWKNRVLRDTTDNRNIINLYTVSGNAHGQQISFYLDTISARRVYLPAAPTVLPKDVVLITLPNEIQLDPLGVARGLGLDDFYFMRKYPLRMRHVPVVTQLKDTLLPEMVRRNQIEKEMGLQRDRPKKDRSNRLR